MPIRSRFISVLTHRTHFTEAGPSSSADRAPHTLVLLASMFVRARSYVPLIQTLAQRFRVLTVELPGSGFSSPLRHPWSFRHYAHWVDTFLAQLALPPVTLIGHSNSGPVALLTPNADPSRTRVARVVLADTVGAHPHPTLPRILLGRSIDAFLEPHLSLRGWPDIAYNVAHHTRTCFHQLFLCRDDVNDESLHAPPPTLLAWGRRDHTMPPSGAHVLRHKLPRATVHVSPHGSHDWLITHPREFTAALTRFIRSTPAAPSPARNAGPAVPGNNSRPPQPDLPVCSHPAHSPSRV